MFGIVNMERYIQPVKCKDCRYFIPYEKPVEDFDGRCFVRGCETDEEEYCSYGTSGEPLEEVIMNTKTKTEFQSIKEKLDHNYYKRSDNNKNSLYESSTYNDKLKALKDAVDELLILLDKAVSFKR